MANRDDDLDRGPRRDSPPKSGGGMALLLILLGVGGLLVVFVLVAAAGAVFFFMSRAKTTIASNTANTSANQSTADTRTTQQTQKTQNPPQTEQPKTTTGPDTSQKEDGKWKMKFNSIIAQRSKDGKKVTFTINYTLLDMPKADDLLVFVEYPRDGKEFRWSIVRKWVGDLKLGQGTFLVTTEDNIIYPEVMSVELYAIGNNSGGAKLASTSVPIPAKGS